MDWFIRRLIVSGAAAVVSTGLFLWLMDILEQHGDMMVSRWGEGAVLLLFFGAIILLGLCFIAVSVLLAHVIGLPKSDRHPDLRAER